MYFTMNTVYRKYRGGFVTQGYDVNELAVILDFDGTITDRDTNNLIFSNLGNEVNAQIEAQFKNQEIGTRESMEKHFAQINLTESEYFQYILSRVEIRQGFLYFVQNCIENTVPLSIVSGGFENIINKMLQEQLPDFAENMNVCANRLHFHGNTIVPEFKHNFINCVKNFGPCGNCKRSYVRELQFQGYRVVFVGDGLTDRCGAETAEVVFARSKLANFCENHGISHIKYNNFTEVDQFIYGNNQYSRVN